MGTDPGPLLANLFLYKSEFEFLDKNTKKVVFNMRIINNTFRYINDLITINADDKSNLHQMSIYPSQLTLNRENVSDQISTFLDFEMAIVSGVIQIEPYDKRTKFGFKIVNYPDLNGNFPKMMDYGVVIIQSHVTKLSVDKDKKFC
ncbi:unnamed protein product [Didymodactylos carnosus]|uniref:Uncharacterized protein n=1 Tax=Didymodactylos carnosus TaxID=1234261 RepID=A0A8S2ETR6_9BILA|nr:unnamed protein product [Didymodactylos carnosus]CAF4064818.1 unnamed protein product [Didymodactylos carnosus]